VKDAPRFWETKRLADFSEPEWEAVCDGCGKCCLHKLEDEDSGAVHYTSVACRLLDLDSGKCRNYGDRHRQVPECLRLDPANLADFHWLPGTCAYRLLAQGDTLRPWHPLLSGRHDSVVEAGVAIRVWAISELEVRPGEDLTAYAVVPLPGEVDGCSESGSG